MNTAQDTTTEVTVNQDPPAPMPRDAITKRITMSQMPVATKKLAAKLLERNKEPGTRFVVTMLDLRSLCHAATNLDVLKHLRRMRALGLLEYDMLWGMQRAELRFVTAKAEGHAKQQD